jgi:ubiquinone/menaquinone biosynthesis C-methylase UbiE
LRDPCSGTTISDMSRLSTLALIVGAAAAAVAAVFVRHRHGHAAGRIVPGGLLMGDASAYDTLSRLLFGSLFKGIASDVAADVPAGSRVLEVGCGPGHLSIALADRHGLDVTGIDLDPAMIERAQRNATRAVDLAERRPTFLAANVASLPFADASFDRVVSTFSMHHWEDPTAGLAELGRVLRPGARAVIWDLRPGSRPRFITAHHDHIPDPADHSQGSLLRVVDSRPWRWPWRLTFAQRIELVRAEDASGGKA